MAEDASTLLATDATEVSVAIFNFIKNRLKPSDSGYKTAFEIAVRLHLVGIYINSLPPYWVHSDVEELCHTLLRDLQANFPAMKGLKSSTFALNSSSFATPFSWNGPKSLESSLSAFFRAPMKDAQDLKNTCGALIDKLAKNENDLEGIPSSAIQDLDDRHETSVGLDDGIYDALQSMAECDPKLHENAITKLPHPARLRLHELERSQDSASRILVLVSATDMVHWQEFLLRIQPENSADDSQQPLSRGDLCQILDRNITARLFLSYKHGHGIARLQKTQALKQIFQAGPGESLASILRNYDLTPKDKVMLAYAVARSYWQYYDSPLMRIKWTSDTIWFMPEKDGGRHHGQLPLCAYLSFPFGVPSNTTSDILNDDMLTNQCPRVFDIGVLLLEIGRAKPFRTGVRRDMVAQANLNHKIATDGLLELEKTDWDGLASGKKYFDGAIRFCLDSENFIPPSEQPRPNQSRAIGPDEQAGVLRRRKTFHKNVVLPLAWLAKKGFRAQAGDITYVNKKPSSSPPTGISNTAWQPEAEALFHTAIVPKMWLRDLTKISEQVERKRRQCRVSTPVRVAILDTRLNRGLPGFKAKSGLLKCIIEEVDFAKLGAPTMTDTFGHGTLMARLIMECAPGAEILVARVAENTSELKSSTDKFKEAILWAGQAGKADIIFMSFGFPSEDEGICEAIETVQKERKGNIIFFASAGNSSTEDESFPARHSSVISVYATNCYGTFLQSNSASADNVATVLGTYGDDIPESIREEFSTAYPRVCEPGSSIATAIMAGISATMLAYASVLPLLVPFSGVAANTSKHALERLWTTKGMEAVLYRLAQGDRDHPRLKAVNPIWFWKSRPDDTGRYCAICDSLFDIDRRFPRPA